MTRAIWADAPVCPNTDCTSDQRQVRYHGCGHQWHTSVPAPDSPSVRPTRTEEEARRQLAEVNADNAEFLAGATQAGTSQGAPSAGTSPETLRARYTYPTEPSKTLLAGLVPPPSVEGVPTREQMSLGQEFELLTRHRVDAQELWDAQPGRLFGQVVDALYKADVQLSAAARDSDGPSKNDLDLLNHKYTVHTIEGQHPLPMSGRMILAQLRDRETATEPSDQRPSDEVNRG